LGKWIVPVSNVWNPAPLLTRPNRGNAQTGQFSEASVQRPAFSVGAAAPQPKKFIHRFHRLHRWGRRKGNDKYLTRSVRTTLTS
jgi:hypothetical protein